MGLKDVIRDLATYGVDYLDRVNPSSAGFRAGQRIGRAAPGVAKRGVGLALEFAGDTILPSSLADFGRELQGAQEPEEAVSADDLVPPGWDIDAIRSAHATAQSALEQSQAQPQPAIADQAALQAREAGDEAARQMFLTGKRGAFEAQPDPWNPRGLAMDSTFGRADARARAAINARHQERISEIEQAAAANDPMRRKLEAEQLNQAYEEVMPYDPRALMTQTDKAGNVTRPGVFYKDKAGSIANMPPTPRLGPARAIEMGARVLTQQRAIFEGLAQVEQQLQAEIEAGQLKPAEAAEAYKQAERRAGLMLQSLAGGKDFSGFFAEPKDPVGAALAEQLRTGQADAPPR